MKIAAITRYKNGALWKALRDAKWTVRQLSEASGVSYRVVLEQVNLLKKAPKQKVVTALVMAFAEVGVILEPSEAWPEDFSPMIVAPVVEQYAEVEAASLMAARGMKEVEDSGLDVDDLKEALNYTLDSLNTEEEIALRMRFLGEATFREIGEALGVSQERVRQICAKGLRKMRHPARMKQLLPFFNPKLNTIFEIDDKFRDEGLPRREDGEVKWSQNVGILSA